MCSTKQDFGFPRLHSELNSLSIFCKKIPLVMQFGRQSLPAHGDISARSNPSSPSIEEHPLSSNPTQFHAFATKRRGTVHPLSGIPFEINKKYVSDLPDDSENSFSSINPKTMEQLDYEYQYRFSVERSLLQT
ncbi:hypothetical protein D915_004446 [Fasciola hepatica]|uniref:UMA domain-containing protein n=1 Tax=Fasciola hepatica TaxID=6192 RepID=A0A4E0RAK9_FASHE|nr:hypothetical protein D915_004446 [Fasciola hepatica]